MLYISSMYLALFCRVVIGVTFALSSVSKIGDIKSFEKAILNFEMIPEELGRIAALVFLSGEFVVVLLVVLGGPFLYFGLVLAIILLTAFSTALAVVLSRGIKISCNCFGSTQRLISPYDLVRNIGLIAISVTGCLSAAILRSDATSFHTIGLGLVVGIAIVFVVIWLNLREILLLVSTSLAQIHSRN